MKAYTLPTGILPSQELRDALRLRMADYEQDEDGFALSGAIWRFWGHVNPHIDDLPATKLVVGFVLDADGHKLVHGDQAILLNVGDVYVLNPVEQHGVLALGHQSTLTLFIGSETDESLRKFDALDFARRAVHAAQSLVRSPPPANDCL